MTTTQPGSRATTTTERALELPAPVEPFAGEVVRVTVPNRSLRSELRAIRIVWRREMTRFWADKIRALTTLAQPFLFLFVLGEGLSHIASAGTHGVLLRTFMYPGILCMAVMATALFSAASFVWDREFGFIREMMVAPVRRSSILIGKALGGASVAGAQGLVVLAIAGLADVPYRPLMLLGAFGIMLLLAFSVTCFGLAIAVRIKQMQAFMGVMQMLILPMFFVSGALFPPANLPGWLTVLNRLDPMSYAVDPMRRLIFANLHVNPLANLILNPGMTWWGYKIPSFVELAAILAIGLVMLAIAAWEFADAD
jgi:ABC-2 type transport system permease protein